MNIPPYKGGPKPKEFVSYDENGDTYIHKDSKKLPPSWVLIWRRLVAFFKNI